MLAQKKHVRVKRKGPSKAITSCTPQHKDNTDETKEPNAEIVTKRKTWDTDIEMVDCLGEQKRTCSGQGILLCSNDSVAVVDEDQPREQQ